MLWTYCQESPNYKLKLKIAEKGLVISDDINDFNSFYVREEKRKVKIKSKKTSATKENKKSFSAIIKNNSLLWEEIIQNSKKELEHKVYQFCEYDNECYISKGKGKDIEYISVAGYALALKQIKRLKLELELPGLLSLLIRYATKDKEFGDNLAFDNYDEQKGWDNIFCIENKKVKYIIPIDATLPEAQNFLSEYSRFFNQWQKNSKTFAKMIIKANRSLSEKMKDLAKDKSSVQAKAIKGNYNSLKKYSFMIKISIIVICLIVAGIFFYESNTQTFKYNDLQITKRINIIENSLANPSEVKIRIALTHYNAFKREYLKQEDIEKIDFLISKSLLNKKVFAIYEKSIKKTEEYCLNKSTKGDGWYNVFSEFLNNKMINIEAYIDLDTKESLLNFKNRINKIKRNKGE